MKKIIIPILLFIIMLIPKTVSALEYVEDTTHESHLIPYYTNVFNDYDTNLYQKAINIINNSIKTGSSSYNYFIIKRYDGTFVIGRFSSPDDYLKLSYSLDSGVYKFNLSTTSKSYYLLNIMNITSSTTTTTFTSDSTFSSFVLFNSVFGYSISGYNGSEFLVNSTILYSSNDVKLDATNINNDNILLKMNLYGTPYTYDTSIAPTELYSSINFSNYDKATVERLGNGDIFYSADLKGHIYTFSSNTYKNATININDVTDSTFDIQFKTDNANVYSPAIYGLYNGEYELITYLDFNYNKFFPTTDIYTVNNNQILVNNEVFLEFVKEYTGFQIRYDLENSSSQYAQFIYSGNYNVSIDYNTTDFDYIIPGQDDITNGNISTDDIANNKVWFERTENYFSSLGEMETIEKLNPIYWLKGIGYILIDLLVPSSSNNSFQKVYDALYEKFPIISDLKSIIEQVFDKNLISNSEEAPKITINMEPLGIGIGTLTLIDFAMFDDFIEYIRIFIVSFMLLELVFWYYKKIGGII